MKKLSLLLAALILLISAAALPASANSAQMHWEGVSSTGMIVTDENCPIIVEKELLTFDIQQFPQEYYRDIDEYLSYTGKVTAEYTFYNPSDYTVTAKLLFPFGTEPTYASNYDSETGDRTNHADTQKYDITVGGEPIEKTLRYSLSERNSQFELARDTALLHDGFVEDDFYSPDLPVTVYLYNVSGVDTEKYPAATVAFDISEDDYPASRIYLANQTGAHYQEKTNTMRIGIDAENDCKIVLWVIGEPLSVPLEWKFYEDGGVEDKEQIDGTVTLYETETSTFKDFAMQGWFEEHTTVSESDWYNAKVALLNDAEATSYGSMLYLWYTRLDSLSLMRWYEYEITLEPGERIVNSVTAPIYPAIDLEYEPDVYEYTYLLSPAKTWAEFGELEIVINTPYYVTESALDGFEKTEIGYRLTLDGLPDGELTFCLSSSETPQMPDKHITDYIPIEIIISFSIIGGVILLIVGSIVAFVLIRKRKKA
ncbi:MAG: hypothetical protein IJY27_06000 [Clostridia bacterium]|nr:hypothetical protein [Clostridia bacterium]